MSDGPGTVNIEAGLDTAARLLFFATHLVAAWTQREWYHKVLAPFDLAFLGIYISVLFLRLS